VLPKISATGHLFNETEPTHTRLNQKNRNKMPVPPQPLAANAQSRTPTPKPAYACLFLNRPTTDFCHLPFRFYGQFIMHADHTENKKGSPARLSVPVSVQRWHRVISQTSFFLSWFLPGHSRQSSLFDTFSSSVISFKTIRLSHISSPCEF